MSKEHYNTLIKSKPENIVFEEMKDKYTMEELSKLFSYKFIFKDTNIHLGWKWSYLFKDKNCINYISKLKSTNNIYLYILPNIEISGYTLFFEELDGNYMIFENEDIDFNFYYLNIEKIPLYIIRKFIDKNWCFNSSIYSLSNNKSLTSEFIKEFIDLQFNIRQNIMKSIWDYNILLQRGICNADISINVCMLDQTLKVDIPSIYPLHSLEYFINKSNVKYFIEGNEEALDNNTKICDLKSNNIFVLFI